jgi:hypothetical protein
VDYSCTGEEYIPVFFLVELLKNIFAGVRDDKEPATKCSNLLMVIIVLLS